MNQDEVTKLLRIIDVDYPNNQIGKDRDLRAATVGRWLQKLGPHDSKQVLAAYEFHLSRSPRFAPSWQDLTGIIAVEMTGADTPEQAWGKLIRAVKKCGYTMQAEAQGMLTGRIWAIVNRFGWDYWCQMPVESESIYYAQFRNAYESEGKREVERLQIPESIRSAIQKIGGGNENSLLVASTSTNKKELATNFQQPHDRQAIYNAVERLQGILEGLQSADSERTAGDA